MLLLQQLHVLNPNKTEPQQGAVLEGYTGTSTGARFMKKVSTASRQETPYGGSGSPTILLRNNNIQQSLYLRDALF